MRTLGGQILAAAMRLRHGGGYRFDPEPRRPTDAVNPRDPLHDGVTRDLLWEGERIARAAPDGATFCCGVTFEAWLDAGPSLTGVGPSDLRDLLADWFCPVMGHAGAAEALVSRGLGRRTTLRTARPGDLCQFWRTTDLAAPSGHSVVFLDHRDGWLTYWSSQRATDGVGVHRERIERGWTVHLARALG
ncbi:MAG: hypothetical protein H6738_15765 [Alphaproteobacteria bacterium]|nr:hypothetical protein [Alphaproteobacteria bacterium]MCB9698236.1 hypothetical protein [Alphaproteobacteria bacterium]